MPALIAGLPGNGIMVSVGPPFFNATFAPMHIIGLEGMRYDEAATVLQIPVGTIRSRLSRGRAELRRELGAAAH